ncbi:Collagenase [Pseudolycoriella hygida]|uniref:Collagenase n=1 Tax=Pseudolycoriella hygida TaxID=35572 RepID=A0A9Q0RYG0_9DIPT|nr:Collagenase [Pseudolycoriella hygida]
MYLPYLGIFIVGLMVTQTAAAPEGRIVNGNVAANYQFPWHVSLTITVSDAASPRYCGASIISSRYLLTAASCLKNAQSVRADMGSTLFSNPKQTQYTVHYAVHPQFNSTYNTNNIGIVRLNDEIYYSNEKRAILLVGRSKVNSTFVDTAAYISGFGVYQKEMVYMSENLRYAYTTVVTNTRCELFYPPLSVSSETLCTTGYNHSLQTGCYGDTGGALVAHIDGTWYQIGLLSSIHNGGCSGTYPNLYTKIMPYLQWINQMTGLAINP